MIEAAYKTTGYKRDTEIVERDLQLYNPQNFREMEYIFFIFLSVFFTFMFI